MSNKKNKKNKKKQSKFIDNKNIKSNKDSKNISKDTVNDNIKNTKKISNNEDTKKSLDVKDNNQKQSFIKRKTTHMSIILGLLLSSGAITAYAAYELKDNVYPGVHLYNNSIALMDKKKLREYLETSLNQILDNIKVSINISKDSHTYSLKELGYFFDIDKIHNEILNLGKKNNLVLDTVKMVEFLFKNPNLIYLPEISEENYNTFVEELKSKYNTAVTEPKISFNGNKMIVTGGENGLEIDITNFKEKLDSTISETISNPNETHKAIIIETKETKPNVSKDVFEKMSILGSHSTQVNSVTTGRTQNIRLFFKKLNATILMPGEEFSADKLGGSRTVKDGYSAAPAYINGKVVNTVAGGICQGTSTLYDAVVKANLKVTERHNHSMPVSYMDIGLDAAIAKGSKDLRFVNNYETPIVVQTYINSSGKVIANIWGIPDIENREIKMRVVNHSSKSCTTYKDTYINGKLVSSEKLHSDKYK